MRLDDAIGGEPTVPRGMEPANPANQTVEISLSWKLGSCWILYTRSLSIDLHRSIHFYEIVLLR